ncbi:MAG TPA: UDP-N-acetylmuramoyl-tripeptide--D-alanyl-D-alanine ligase [Candidatus Bathyarchaeia archaeon]|nr:UDP-N-acetylmuramoyl-tripeptide--D-alanyl-D-alanine ligase [Candidatus Bathyarchaeia archaeon]
MQFDREFIKTALPDAIIEGLVPVDVSFSVDTRTLQPGSIFVALSGAVCDGHNFVAQAFEKGAAGCIIVRDKKNILNNIDKKIREQKCIIMVADTKKALVDCARAWRRLFTYPVFGVTGSVGKTSTKELLGTIVRHYGMNVLVSHENQNTLIGIPLNILRMRAHHEAAIFELGISQRGEMVELAGIVRPTVAIITNVGHQHMDGLGSLHDIASEKRAIFKYFTENNIGIINGDHALLSDVAYAHPVIRFGSKTINQIQARKIHVHEAGINFVLKIYGKKYSVSVPQVHGGFIYNILAAVAGARLLNIPDASIIAAIQVPVVVAGRFEARQICKGTLKGCIINDCYNASPESMKAALLAFENMQTSATKVAVIGDMLGLGVNSPFWHRQIGRFLRKVPSLKRVILVGNYVTWTKKTAPVCLPITLVQNWQEAIGQLENEKDQVAVLVKGSLAVGLGNLVGNFT